MPAHFPTTPNLHNRFSSLWLIIKGTDLFSKWRLRRAFKRCAQAAKHKTRAKTLKPASQSKSERSL
jgi:hypothetical protein